MEARFYLRVSAAVFGLVGLGHLLRIVFGWPLIIGTLHVPMYVSWLAVFVSGGLSAWAIARLPRRMDQFS